MYSRLYCIAIIDPVVVDELSYNTGFPCEYKHQERMQQYSCRERMVTCHEVLPCVRGAFLGPRCDCSVLYCTVPGAATSPFSCRHEVDHRPSEQIELSS